MVRLVALVTAAAGLALILGRWTTYRHALDAVKDSVPVAGIGIAALVGVVLLIPVLKIGIGLGLWTARRWARRAAMIVLAADVLVSAVAIVRFHWPGRDLPSVSDLAHRGATVVAVHSLWPTYLGAALSAGCLLVLLQARARRQPRAS